ncbi:unnamed protein product [Amoebophrya sp. A25]|nr:unnamed protein product [Amoebophrya sp. A25]|eukprot:GSA25T00017028001.1
MDYSSGPLVMEQGFDPRESSEDGEAGQQPSMEVRGHPSLPGAGAAVKQVVAKRKNPIKIEPPEIPPSAEEVQTTQIFAQSAMELLGRLNRVLFTERFAQEDTVAAFRPLIGALESIRRHEARDEARERGYQTLDRMLREAQRGISAQLGASAAMANLQRTHPSTVQKRIAERGIHRTKALERIVQQSVEDAKNTVEAQKHALEKQRHEKVEKRWAALNRDDVPNSRDGTRGGNNDMDLVSEDVVNEIEQRPYDFRMNEDEGEDMGEGEDFYQGEDDYAGENFDDGNANAFLQQRATPSNFLPTTRGKFAAPEGQAQAFGTRRSGAMSQRAFGGNMDGPQTALQKQQMLYQQQRMAPGNRVQLYYTEEKQTQTRKPAVSVKRTTRGGSTSTSKDGTSQSCSRKESSSKNTKPKPSSRKRTPLAPSSRKDVKEKRDIEPAEETHADDLEDAAEDLEDAAVDLDDMVVLKDSTKVTPVEGGRGVTFSSALRSVQEWFTFSGTEEESTSTVDADAVAQRPADFETTSSSPKLYYSIDIGDENNEKEKSAARLERKKLLYKYYARKIRKAKNNVVEQRVVDAARDCRPEQSMACIDQLSSVLDLCYDKELAGAVVDKQNESSADESEQSLGISSHVQILE